MWGAETTVATTGDGKSASTRGNLRGTSTLNDDSNMYLYWAIQESDSQFRFCQGVSFSLIFEST